MKTAVGLLLVLLCIPICAQAQEDDEWPPLSYLRHDFNEAVAVAHVQVTKAEIVNRIEGYENWKLVCTVVEPFKGGMKKDTELEFYHGAESGFSQQLFLGDKLVFLLHDYDKTRRARIYSVIENSTLKYNQDRARKLRLIARSPHRKRAPPKRRNHAGDRNIARCARPRTNSVSVTTV